MKRREFLTAAALGTGISALSVFGEKPAPADEPAVEPATEPAAAPTKEIVGDPRVRGPFPILSTPYTESGEVDFDVLAKEARFIDWCGSSGMIWPQSNDSIELLTMDEKLRGMTVLAETMKGRSSALCLGVQGKDTEEMLVYARHAASLNPTAIISRPPDSGTSQEDMRDYWRALAREVSCPVIIQTFGGGQYKGPGASVELLIELGTEFPHFGYVKEETRPVAERMVKLLAARPAIKRVFAAYGGFGWLHRFRIGAEGLITERAVYADLLQKIWTTYNSGDSLHAAELYAKYLLMLDLRETIPCQQLRGYHLYVWQKRGVFKNRLSREFGPKNTIPEKPILSDLKLTSEQTDEIDLRFEVIRSELREGNFEAQR